MLLKIIQKIGGLAIGNMGENSAIKCMSFIVYSARKTAQYKGKSNGQIRANKDKGTKIMENKGIKMALAMGEIMGKDAKNKPNGTIEAIMAAYCILINELILLFFCFLMR